MEYYIGIASYKRASKQKTLDYLEKLSFPKDRIIFSVQTEEDLQAYTEAGIGARVGSLLMREAHNTSGNRNTILDRAGPGTRIAVFDDDVAGISRLKGDRLIPIETAEDFDRFITYGYRQAAKYHTPLWGVYPVHNAYYMSGKIRDRNIIEGTFLGIYNTDLRFDEGIGTKEDYDYGCRVIRKYGHAVRLDGFACNAAHYTGGGCDELWKDTETVKRTAAELIGRYPDILKANPRRPGEVLMKKTRESRK